MARTAPTRPRPPRSAAYRWDGEGRINFLLLGTDAAPGRDEILTDVVLVLSLDPAERTAAMISVPRDTGYVPLPDTRIYADGVFPGKANELASVAAADPELWCPDLDGTPVECGIRTVREAIGLYVGLELPYYAIVDMAGFASSSTPWAGWSCASPVGSWIRSSASSCGPATPPIRSVLPAGCNHYGGLSALAFARSRQGWIEMPDGTRLTQTDFDRNERQQQVLIGVRNELAAADLFSELPDILRAIGRTVDSDFPRDQAGDLASLLPLITGPEIERIVLDYPRYVDAPSQPEFNYLLEPRRNAIREEMGRLFGRDDLQGWYLGTDALGPPAAELDDASNELPPNL